LVSALPTGFFHHLCITVFEKGFKGKTPYRGPQFPLGSDPPRRIPEPQYLLPVIPEQILQLFRLKMPGAHVGPQPVIFAQIIWIGNQVFLEQRFPHFCFWIGGEELAIGGIGTRGLKKFIIIYYCLLIILFRKLHGRK